MLSYIIQVVLFQILFLAVYDIFLSRETFFKKNRFYLIFSVVVSFILPLIKLPAIKHAVPQEYTILLPEVVLSPQTIIENQEWYQSVSYLDVLFWIGVSVASLFFLIKLYNVIKLLLENNVEQRKDYKLINLPNSTKAFSFFNFIFIGENIPNERREKIIQHELVHAKQKHTLDLLFFEILKICMWFNPILWVFQKRITTVHEFLSDEVASKSLETKTYINSLLEQVFQVEKISFVNQFYKSSLIKKRIIMMTKKRSTKVKQFKYLLIAPVLLSMLLYTACSDNEISEDIEQRIEKSTKVEEESSTVHPFQEVKGINVLYGGTEPKGKELEFEDLSSTEQQYYIKIKNSMQVKARGLELKIYENNQKEKVVFVNMNKLYEEIKKESLKEGNVPFSMIDKSPAFMNSGNSKDEFNRNMRDFIQKNFDVNLANSLGLKKGKKRIFAQFKINENGHVVNIKVRAPHPTLKEHTKEMIKKLPLLIPGEKDGKVVKVGYTLPITFDIN